MERTSSNRQEGEGKCKASSTSSSCMYRQMRGMATMHLLVLVFLSCVCHSAATTGVSKFNNYVPCEVCDESKCPQLAYCEGKAIKDHCGCCTVCSSSRFQPHVVVAKPVGGDACEQVKCPKRKVCVENMQGVPLCTCPSEFICGRNKKREICGTDGKTYPSRCHMRIASCNQGISVRKRYRGECSAEDNDKQSAKYKKRLMRKLKKMKKLKRKRRQKKKNEIGGPDKGGRKKKKHRRRRRRKSGNRISKGKSRSRRHRNGYFGTQAHPASRTFEETFPFNQYTWSI